MLEMARVYRSRIGSYHWFTARLEGFSLKRTIGVFCNSSFTEQLIRPRTRRTWLVPNALRPDFFQVSPTLKRPARCVFVHAGVVCENKQQLKMLDLARSLHQKKLDFVLHFVGSTNSQFAYDRAFLELIREAEADGYARYLGNKSAAELNKLIDCFDGASALVHTPITETFGLVVAEALSRNLRVFGFRVGGVPDIVEGAGDAVLVAPDDWAALENAIEAWIRAGHPPSRPTASLMRARYHPEVIARRHIEIYRDVLAGRSLSIEH
jgi:glycosyltransferase involved in cell wall biosynthesis